MVTTKRAFECLVLTAARSGEVRLATWDEMDLDAGVWTIPAARMKAKRDYRVPLSGRALAILHDVQRLSDGTGLVVRSRRGKPLSTVTRSKLIKELGIAAVPHGFRSSFRDWAAEQTNTPREVVEAALAHTVRNPTEAAYARSDFFERRRRLMDDLACHRDEVTHFISISYIYSYNRFPSSHPSLTIRCPRALKTLCGRLEIVDRRDDYALIRRCGARSPPPPLSPNDDRASASDAYAWPADRGTREPNRRAGLACTSSGVRALAGGSLKTDGYGSSSGTDRGTVWRQPNVLGHTHGDPMRV